MRQSNLSEQSNFFALSSESSHNTPHHKPSKKHYSAFIKKVKHLLQADNDDLDELYRKVEIIVRKYFHQHKIVQFSDMYEHIASLKSNSSKMVTIVALLQRRIIKQEQSLRTPLALSRKSTKKVEQNQGNSQQAQLHIISKQQRTVQQQIKQQKQSLGSAATSVQNSMEISRHVYHKSDAITTSLSEESKISKQPKPNQNIKKKEANMSPDRLNSSFQEYQTRNRQYEQKVRELISQLKDIKASMKQNSEKLTQPPKQQAKIDPIQLKINLIPNNQQSLQINRDSSQNSKGKKEAKEEKQEIKSETSLIEMCLQKNLMNETNQTSLTESNQPTQQIMLKKKLQSIQEKSNQSITSNKTIPSAKKIQHQQHPNKQTAALANPVLSVQQRKLMLLKQAQNITKQLHQLRTFASQLQLQPVPEKQRAQHQQVSQMSQNIFATLQLNNNRILQKIAPSVSRSMIQSNPPSFKELRNSQQKQLPLLQQSIKVPKTSERMIDSSAFSFSQNKTHPPMVQLRPIAKSNHILLTNEQYARSSSSKHNTNSNGNLNSTYHPYPQQAQSIKYIYHPYANANVSSHMVKNNSIHFSHGIPQTYSMNHLDNHSQTSIMRRHSPAPQQLQSKTRQVGIDANKYAHLKANQPSRSLSKIQQNPITPAFNYSLPVNQQMQRNSTTLRKKGINMLSPQPTPFLHR